MKSLSEKTVSGIIWTVGQQFGVQLINFAVQILLARLLLPAEFGLIAMLTVFISVGNALVDSGLTSSLIRTHEADETDYTTVFFINLISSIVIYAVIFVSAPGIASFYEQPELTAVIRVYTITFILQALMAVQATRLTKEMNFKAQMLMQLPAVMVGGIVGVTLAYLQSGVWSLVSFYLSQTFILVCLYWLRSKWRPKFIIDTRKLKHHFRFGYKLTLAAILNAVFTNIYNLVIGKYFSATQLGYYNRADTLQLFPVQNISTALNKVTYPMFATIQNDLSKLKNAYKKIMQQVVFWLTPLMIFLAIIAEPLFRIVLTEKWIPAVPYFRILCAVGILYPLQLYNLNILNVLGRSDLFLKLEVIKKIIIGIGVALSIRYGIYGLLYFQVFFSILAFFINSFFSGRLISYPVMEQLRDILPLYGMAFLSGLCIWRLDVFLIDYYTGIHDVTRIIINSAAFAIFYLSVSFLLRVPALNDFRQLILKR
ncbi:lipopolysaccharide biosynthesis protein [Chitinophaga sp. NPDC101104]|uniref:lipopolysaccharide biosynthesis protein n=1 Tax=Chitinophaga sp. NPDC101104 TaxID=3390561 RepID=UPI003CFE26AA